MNCQLCGELSEAYAEDKLSCLIKDQVEAHLSECVYCRDVYRLQALAGKVMEREKETSSDPFLATRVMAMIENTEVNHHIHDPLFRRVLRPVLITAVLSAAVFYGITIGNMFHRVADRQAIPVELALIDDGSIELLDLLSTE